MDGGDDYSQAARGARQARINNALARFYRFAYGSTNTSACWSKPFARCTEISRPHSAPVLARRQGFPEAAVCREMSSAESETTKPATSLLNLPAEIHTRSTVWLSYHLAKFASPIATGVHSATDCCTDLPCWPEDLGQGIALTLSAEHFSLWVSRPAKHPTLVCFQEDDW